MNLGFNEPWTGDVFALDFDKLVEPHRGLPRTDLGFYELVKLTKADLGFGELLENQPKMRAS